MKVCIYVNKEKDIDKSWLNSTIKILENNNVEWQVIDDYQTKETIIADALMILGGDGTILSLTEVAYRNKLAIIGINAGKIGFLTEYEKYETEDAVKDLLNGRLIIDERALIKVKTKKSEYLALNDAVIQRIYTEMQKSLVANINIEIDGNNVDDITGDGTIICTPTGSTAYSLSAGGAILAPGISAFSITPISAHSLHNRPIIYSADSICKAHIKNGSEVGLFIDGEMVEKLDEGDAFIVNKAEQPIIFLRKSTSNFYSKLNQRLNRGKTI